eukprot:998338-Amphidinium_carterae.1
MCHQSRALQAIDCCGKNSVSLRNLSMTLRAQEGAAEAQVEIECFWTRLPIAILLHLRVYAKRSSLKNGPLMLSGFLSTMA